MSEPILTEQKEKELLACLELAQSAEQKMKSLCERAERLENKLKSSQATNKRHSG